METKTAWVQEMLAQDLATQHLGIRVLDIGDGTAITEMTVTQVMCNGHLTTHGGYVFLLADTTFAVACNSGGQPTVAAGAQIRFIQPTHAGDVLTARATRRASWGRSGIYDVAVHRGDELIAEFRGDSREVRAKKP